MPPTPYDAIPYHSFPYRASHPDRLAATARLFHLSPAPVSRCRVLELACASGGNLLPIASALPDSHFVGVDLASTSIDLARGSAAALQLRNTEFHTLDLARLPHSLGEFDFVIAHGVFSWIPPEAQGALLDALARHLAPQGVAFVSHNVYPGWYARAAVRGMMRYHAARFDGVDKQLEQSRALLEFVARNTGPSRDAYRAQIEAELAIVASKPAWYVRHDHLSEHNSALYLHELVAQLSERGLEFLGDAEFATMFPHELSPDAAQQLEEISPNVPAMEQYLDFVRNRVFRQTLVCRAGLGVSRSLHGRQLREFYLASPARAESGSLTVRHPNGLAMAFESEATRAAFDTMASAWPASVPFEALSGASHDDDAVNALGRDLLRAHASALLEVSLRASDYVTRPGEFPRASAYARWQCTHSERITTLRHETMDLEPAERTALSRMDGTRDRETLRAAGVDDATIERFARAALLVA